MGMKARNAESVWVRIARLEERAEEYAMDGNIAAANRCSAKIIRLRKESRHDP